MYFIDKKISFKTAGLISGLSVLFVLGALPVSAQIFGADMQEPPAEQEAPAAAPADPVFNPLSRAARPTQAPAPKVEIKEAAAPQADKDLSKEQHIFLFMRDFQVRTGFHGEVSCSMNFYVASTLSEKISNISYRLKWPDMETPLSFDNVQPGETLYRSYSLLGKGCYNMDTLPNIIVNRCRVKNMTQQTCASYISWMQ
ncbi:MAG: hypothetical protein J6X42_02720 [Alphaproteobacteria bacterium]|nr:hypothetical protein [Alphaproteobacteria bacterium]